MGISAMNALHRVTTAALAASLMLFAGYPDVAAAGSRSEQVAQEDINDVHSGLLRAYNAKNAIGVASFYTDDAILMPPNLAPVKSKIAVGDFMRQILAPPFGGILMNIAETVVSGDYAFSTGYYTMLRADGTTLDTGKFVEVLKNDGGWKIYRDIYNSDMVAATQPAQTTPAGSVTNSRAAGSGVQATAPRKMRASLATTMARPPRTGVPYMMNERSP